MTKTLPILSFAKLEQGMPMPHLLDIQTRAFQSLLQTGGKAGGTERGHIRVGGGFRSSGRVGVKIGH